MRIRCLFLIGKYWQIFYCIYFCFILEVISRQLTGISLIQQSFYFKYTSLLQFILLFTLLNLMLWVFQIRRLNDLDLTRWLVLVNFNAYSRSYSNDTINVKKRKNILNLLKMFKKSWGISYLKNHWFFHQIGSYILLKWRMAPYSRWKDVIVSFAHFTCSIHSVHSLKDKKLLFQEVFVRHRSLSQMF